TLIGLDNNVNEVQNKLDTIIQELNILRIRQPNHIHTQRVEPNHLYDPLIGQMSRGSENYPILRKFLNNCVDVACKPIRDDQN
ncbi:21253_t:CDS:1, partial [Racocetra persica]